MSGTSLRHIHVLGLHAPHNKACYDDCVNGTDLRTARAASNWTQAEAAHRLGVTQAYLSMVERGARPVSEELATAVLKVYPLPPTARPLHIPTRNSPESFYKESLGELGYPGFAYLKSRTSTNPAELLLRALDEDELDARVVEALPWLPFRFPEMNWQWLMTNAKLRDRQNRLAFVTALAMRAARERNETVMGDALALQVERLERSRLAVEDTLCKASLSQAERRWLQSHRTEAAAHWNLLTDLKVEDLAHLA